MPSSRSRSPDGAYFIDLSRHSLDEISAQNGSESGDNASGAKESNTNPPETEAQARPKRMACVLCRRRKLRCDGARPACATCKRLSHNCTYDEVRKKSGPKRGYVKLLEARLQQVETLLKKKNEDPMSDSSRKPAEDPSQKQFTVPSGLRATSMPLADSLYLSNIDPQLLPPGNDSFLGMPMASDAIKPTGEEFSWEMIGLGLEEPLPLQDTVNELQQIYFERIHPSTPIVHRPRYLAAMNLAPQMRPPVGLRYIMWCMAASITDKYEAMAEHFYHRARKYLQMEEMKGHGESIVTVGVCQAWLLVALYEFKLMYFPRAWLSVGRACRLAQMMCLHRLDGAGLDVKQCIPPPRDWTEREERRRTFWMTFCCDRYASIGTGWPMIIDERDIMTHLPASEEAFDKSRPHPTTSLEEAMKPGGATKLTPLGGVVLMACVIGRNLTHLHRPTSEDREDDLEGAFWQRHRELEGILTDVRLSLPDHLKLPAGLPDVNVIFLNMSIHTSAICLHQAAIFKADRFKLPANVGSECRVRCMAAAAEIAKIMRMLVHLDLSSMNPFVSFSVYVAARVFVQYLKFRPKDGQMISSLQFLVTAMQALKKRNPLTDCFIVQLDLDLAAAGIDIGQPNADYNGQAPTDVPPNREAVRGCPLFGARDSQNPHGSTNPMCSGQNPSPHFQNHGIAPQSHSTFADVTDNTVPTFQNNITDLNMDKPQSQSCFNYLKQTNPGETTHHQSTTDLTANVVATATSLSTSSNEMDISDANVNNDPASPSTDESRQGSTSHTSYDTPPNSIDPSLEASAIHMGSTAATTRADTSLFPVSEDMDFNIHSNFGLLTSQASAPLGGEVFIFPAGWEISMGATGAPGGTGLTPMVDPTWNNIMDGWEEMTPHHGVDAFGRTV